MAIQVAQTLYDAVDASLKTLLTGGTAKVMAGMAAVLGTFWLLSFTIRSIQWLWMGMTEVYKDVIYEIAKVTVITAMAFNVGWYIETIVPFVSGLPTWMGGIFSGQDGGQMNNQVDTLINAYIDGVTNLSKAAKVSIIDLDFAEALLGLLGVGIYLLGGIPFLLVAVGTLITLKVSTAIMLALGPLFIAFLLFDQTRQWFFGWVSLLAGFMLTQVLFSIVIGMEMGFINTHVVSGGKIDSSLEGCFAMLIYFAAFTVLATELPNYAASVMGGTPISSTGVGGLIGRGTGVGSALKMAKGAAGAGRYLKGKFGNKFS